MISIKHKGDFRNTKKLFTKWSRVKAIPIIERYAKEGVSALAAATPKDTGLTASSWDYRINVTKYGYTIEWFNTNENGGLVVAILIQYGHGTGSGGFVQGIDFINPALKPIFEKLAENLWKEVTG